MPLVEVTALGSNDYLMKTRGVDDVTLGEPRISKLFPKAWFISLLNNSNQPSSLPGSFSTERNARTIYSFFSLSLPPSLPLSLSLSLIFSSSR